MSLDQKSAEAVNFQSKKNLTTPSFMYTASTPPPWDSIMLCMQILCQIESKFGHLSTRSRGVLFDHISS